MNIITLLSILLVGSILLIIIFFLIKLNSKLQSWIDLEKLRIYYYKNEIDKFDKSLPANDNLEKLNKIARDFFNERYGLRYNLTYMELAVRYRRLSKETHAQFCDLMNELIYSGRRITSDDFEKVLKLFRDIVDLPELNI
jgi:hypothetical protein